MRSKYGFYKVATANFITHVGDVIKNKNEIVSLIEKAKKENISLLIFSELSLTGYTAQDLFFHKELIDDELISLKEIITKIPSSMIVFVGGIFSYLDNLYNVAFVLTSNKILGIVPKSYLPIMKKDGLLPELI